MNPENQFFQAAKRAVTPLLLGVLLSLAGCIPNRGYRTQLPPCKPGSDGALLPTCSVQVVKSVFDNKPVDIPVAFVEFDDVGQAFKRGQIKAAEDVIRAERQQHKDDTVVTVLFIHGWKNNASDNTANVPGFRRFLQEFEPKLPPHVRLVGVYFGWRGGTTNLAVVKELTYWNRRDDATYIPGSNLSEALLRVARAAKGPEYNDPQSNFVVVGHSFGGLVLERTVTQYLTRRVVEHEPTDKEHSGDFRPFADLLVFVNEAAAATEAIQLLTMLKDSVELQTYPTIVSITSEGDMATRFILPVGQGASLLKPSKKGLRDYGPPSGPAKEYDADPFGIAKQRSYYLRSATHIQQLQSHVIGSEDNKDILNAYKDTDQGYTCASIPFVDGNATKFKNYYVVRRRAAPNNTPYWIMQMPTEIVADHSNVFRIEFATLLQAFVLRQAADEKPDYKTCYRQLELLPPTQTPHMEQMKSAIRVKAR